MRIAVESSKSLVIRRSPDSSMLGMPKEQKSLHRRGPREGHVFSATAPALLAADLRGTGVRANSILPSIIDTEANRKAMPQADFAKWPKPEDIARVILFL